MQIVESAFSYYRRLGKVKQFVEAHLSEDLPAARLAEIAGLERKYFSSFFKKRTGIRYRDWVGSLRVRRAQELIRSANYPIARVAFAVGFKDLRTFERVFKRHTSMTPQAYKKSVRTHTLVDGLLGALVS